MRKVKYDDIRRRVIALEVAKVDNLKECDLLFGRIDRDKLDRNTLSKFINTCAESTVSSDKYVEDIINMIKEFKGNKVDRDSLISLVESKIIPILSQPIKTDIRELHEALDFNIICDRMISNHSYLIENNNGSLPRLARKETEDLLLHKCCEEASKLKVVSRGKVIIALEEFGYLKGKYGLGEVTPVHLNSILEYFSIRDNHLFDNIPLLESTMGKNKVVEYEGVKVNEYIDIFLMSKFKTPDLLTKTITDIICLSKNFEEDMRELFKLFRDILVSSTDSALVSHVYNKCIPHIYFLFCNRDVEVLKDNIDSMLNLIPEEIAIARTYIKNFDNVEVESRYTHYINSMKDLHCQIGELSDIVYNRDNILRRNSFLSEKVNLPKINKKTFNKVFKQDNILHAVSRIDKFLAKKINDITTVCKKKVKSLKKTIFEDASIYEFLDEDCFIDYVVESYEVEGGITREIHDIFEHSCKVLNAVIKETGFRCYYLCSENILEFHIKSDTQVELSEEELLEFASYISETDYEYLYPIKANYNINKIPTRENIEEFIENASTDELDLFVELSSYAGIERDELDNYLLYTEYNILKYEDNVVDKDLQMEAVNLIYDLVTEDANKDNKDGNVQGINFTNIRLGLEGLKKKVKDLGAKEQAASRNADVVFNTFVKNIKKALVSDRREAIIKGSVIPSFSRCIKISIALVGLGIVTGGPAIPAIVALGGLALSKNLTKKERALLLDELEIELEIIEKEIQIADSKNQIKKQRALMRQKKEIQRQYQRIKYNIRLGKDLIPSTTGISADTH